jgi:hypothetical protein
LVGKVLRTKPTKSPPRRRAIFMISVLKNQSHKAVAPAASPGCHQGVGEDAGRDAYLAGFRLTRAVIRTPAASLQTFGPARLSLTSFLGAFIP